MIAIENVEIVGFAPAIRGMRNPKNSWDRSDSHTCIECMNEACGIKGLDDLEEGKVVEINVYCDICSARDHDHPSDYKVGPNDLELMLKLAKGGSVHAKYRRYIDVYVDITAPLYFWKEFETYRTVVNPNPFDIEMNGCSTMHKIHDKEFELDDFSHEHLYGPYKDQLVTTIRALNKARYLYLQRKTKNMWWQMIQLLPSSYNQRRTIKLNYEVLAQFYRDRRNHKLDEWIILCGWIEELPYSEIITASA